MCKQKDQLDFDKVQIEIVRWEKDNQCTGDRVMGAQSSLIHVGKVG